MMLYNYCVEPTSVSDLSTLHPDILEDLRFRLTINRQEIIERYTFYVDYIRMSMTGQGVTVKDLRIFLLGLSAFSHCEQQYELLSSRKLKEASCIGDIFILLLEEYSSFLNYRIFQVLQKKYVKDEGQEELKYPEYLKAYVEKHNIVEFVEIKGGLKEVPGDSTETSEKMILKIDIEETSKLAKLMDLRRELAKILKVTPLGLQLLDIEKGCVVVTFLVLKSIADVIFSGEKDRVFSTHQIKEFQGLPIWWLKCKKYMWDFKDDISSIQGMHISIRKICEMCMWLQE